MAEGSPDECCSLVADANGIVGAQSGRITAIARQADTLGQMADELLDKAEGFIV